MLLRLYRADVVIATDKDDLVEKVMELTGVPCSPSCLKCRGFCFMEYVRAGPESHAWSVSPGMLLHACVLVWSTLQLLDS